MVSDRVLTYERSIPVRHSVDVLVAGGGPAGVAAAVAAARQGRRVFLVEEQACLGGMGTAGLVPAFMMFSDGVNFLAAGIGEEVLTRLRENGGTGPDNAFSIRAEVLKRVYDDMLLEAGVEFLFHTKLIDVRKEGRKVCYAILAAKSGLFAIEAKVFVDGTGDGDLAVLAGAEYLKGDEEGHMQPGTLCSLWADIDWSRVKPPDDRMLEQAFKDRVFTYEDRHLPGMWRVGQSLGGGNIGHIFGVDGTDERSLTAALIQGRKLLDEYERYYKEYLDGYERMELAATGALMGIRESRRIVGDYELCLADFHRRAVFPDEIGRYCYPVDIHASTPTDEHYERYATDFHKLRYAKGESYGIPYRCLTPKGLDNVLVAGRSISSDRFLQGSVRVMPGCYITGQAAGIAAAIAAERDCSVRDFPIAELQRRLKDLGAYLPNFDDKEEAV